MDPENIQEDTDFERFYRKDDSCLKYEFTAMDFPDIDYSRAIILNYADMEFKFCPKVTEKLKHMLDCPIDLGYSTADQQVNAVLFNYLSQNIYPDIKMQWCTYWSSVLNVITAVYYKLLKEGDKYMVLTPTYYRFLVNAQALGRVSVQSRLKQQNGRFLIDFQDMEQTLKKGQIKLIVFANPHNPAGRCWTKQQLLKLSGLVCKYKIPIYSDEIFAMIAPKEKFTSLIAIQQVHPYLICAYSHSKTFNCSGNPVAVTFVPNLQLKNKMRSAKDQLGYFPLAINLKIMKLCLLHGEDWKNRLMKYLRENYQMMVKFFQEKLPKVKVYQLQSAFLPLIDFEKCDVTGEQVKEMLKKVQVYPTFMQKTFLDVKPRTMIRLNIACNRQVLREALERIAQAMNEIKKE